MLGRAQNARPPPMKPSDALALRSLLEERPIAALATLHKGEPAVSMVPYALLPNSTSFVIHVSRLATHTNDMLANSAVSLLVTASVEAAESPLALPRASVQGRARPCDPDASEYRQARTAYLEKLPAAEQLFSFSDFSLFLIEPHKVRYVAGFGSAMSITAEQLAAILGPAA
jgi:heme iron utilization protein